MQASPLRTFELFFGCHHQQLSRAFTIRKRTYQVCVTCGREFEYSWELMHAQRSHGADDVSSSVSACEAGPGSHNLFPTMPRVQSVVFEMC
jgi:hypothetical protein